MFVGCSINVFDGKDARARAIVSRRLLFVKPRQPRDIRNRVSFLGGGEEEPLHSEERGELSKRKTLLSARGQALF